MTCYTKSSIGNREKLTHRFLHCVHNRTSPKYPEWRNTTVRFFFELFELMNGNPGLSILVHRDDGLYIYSGAMPIANLHFYQRHFLIHALRDYLLWDSGNRIFSTRQQGSWPRMWKVATPDEISGFLAFLGGLRVLDISLRQTRE